MLSTEGLRSSERPRTICRRRLRATYNGATASSTSLSTSTARLEPLGSPLNPQRDGNRLNVQALLRPPPPFFVYNFVYGQLDQRRHDTREVHGRELQTIDQFLQNIFVEIHFSGRLVI